MFLFRKLEAWAPACVSWNGEALSPGGARRGWGTLTDVRQGPGSGLQKPVWGHAVHLCGSPSEKEAQRSSSDPGLVQEPLLTPVHSH